jgi:acetolactate decarboxylase
MFDPALAAAAHGHISQVDTFTDLYRAHYEAHTTVAETFHDFTLGLGVAEACDGEIVAFDGRVWRVPADGYPVPAEPSLGLPFAVVAQGGMPIDTPVPPGSTMNDITTLVADVVTAGDLAQPTEHLVAAVRIDGVFTDVVLRSEHRQKPPYPPLPDVLSHEVRFEFPTWEGTLVGFRFPDAQDGVVNPGLHLHGLAVDRNSGGHCHTFSVAHAILTVWLDDVAVTLPHEGLAEQVRARLGDNGG